LRLQASAARVPIPATEPGCTTTEEVYSKVFVAKAFFEDGRRGPLSESNVDAGVLFCKKDDVALLLGKATPACQAEAQRRRAKGKILYTCPPGYYLGGTSDNPFAPCFPN